PDGSISSSAGGPCSRLSRTGSARVPYLLPANFATQAVFRRRPCVQTPQYPHSGIPAPSLLPAAARVVTEAEIQISGRRRRRAAPTVLFPTPEGPESTVSREFFRSAGRSAPAGAASPAAPVPRALPPGAPTMSSR